MIGLACNCGTSAQFTSDRAAYDAGWRLHKNRQLCPACAGKIEARHRRERVKRYGEAAVRRADAQVDRLLGRTP